MTLNLRRLYDCLFVGGYYLTSVYASLCLIQSKPGATPTCSLTNEAQEYLMEWSRRRGQEAKTQKDSQLKQVETIEYKYILYIIPVISIYYLFNNLLWILCSKIID